MNEDKATEKKLEIETSRNFGSWLKSVNGSIAFTTYQVGKIFMVGCDPTGKVKITERTFPRCMGLAMNEDSVWMSSIFQVWKFENSLLPNQNYQGYDRVYIPQMAYTTGDLDVQFVDHNESKAKVCLIYNNSNYKIIVGIK